MTALRIAVEHLDVFAAAPGGGNPCPIVVDAKHLGADEMQSIAAHYGQESGFVVRDDDGGLRFRFFVPRHEMAMCVHATIAACTVLAAAGALDAEVTVRTASGDSTVTVGGGDPPVVSVEQQRPQFGAPVDAADEIAAALGLPSAAVDDHMPIQSVSVSRPKLIIPLRSADDVHRCAPDFDRLWSICRRLDVTGAYPFAPHGDHLEARQFPVDAGYPEDPATGVAAGALAAYLANKRRPSQLGWRTVSIEQGAAMGRPSRLQASAFADADGVYRSSVSGTATLRTRERLDLRELEPARVTSELR
jgi:PhzF family phenazine biosynthesis protein